MPSITKTHTGPEDHADQIRARGHLNGLDSVLLQAGGGVLQEAIQFLWGLPTEALDFIEESG
jgi:hypothetical protein